MMLGGQGIPLGLRGQATNAVRVAPGQSYNIPPGNFMLTSGPYTSLQWLDPVTGKFRTVGASPLNAPQFIQSDGGNYRLANLTGCPVGALITNAGGANATNGIGSAATGLTITPSTGASVWQPIVGGAISTTVVTGKVGSGYTYPPTVIVSAPPAGGLQATAHCTLTTGTIPAANVVIDNQGAGYSDSSPPAITFVNDPRDTTGAGAACTVTTTGTSTLTGLYPINHGTPLTAVPTLAFSAGTAAATAIMNFTVTGFTVGTAGTAYSTVPMLVSGGNFVVGTNITTNPLHTTGLTFPRPARIVMAAASTTVLTSGAVIEDAGFGIQGVPSLAILGQGSATAGTIAATVGGTTDVSFLQPV
jgi:hypothetical protein